MQQPAEKRRSKPDPDLVGIRIVSQMTGPHFPEKIGSDSETASFMDVPDWIFRKYTNI